MSCIYSSGSHNISNSRNRKVSDISSDNGKITFEADKNDDSQLWEVLPYWTDDYPYGLVIRSKVMVDDSGVGKSLYLSYDNGKIIATTDRDPFCRINLPDIADWVRFGKIYADSQNWINLNAEDSIYINEKNIKQSLKNYSTNTYIGLDASNKYYDSGIRKELLILQSSGNFPLLTYAQSSMDKVICEVIATHNAMILADVQRNDDDFFRLASEFEVNARIPTNKFIMMDIDLKIYSVINALNLIPKIDIEASDYDLSYYWNKGGLGSNPLKIGDCLKAYNLKYNIHNTCYDFQNDLNVSKGGIISYSFDIIRLHTYSIRYNPTEPNGLYYRGYNRYSNEPKYDEHVSVEKNIKASSDSNNILIIGYTVK